MLILELAQMIQNVCFKNYSLWVLQMRILNYLYTQIIA